MVEISKNELAVIFEPSVNENGNIVYKPIDVVSGYYDERNERFIDTDLNSYGHLNNYEKSKCYAYRHDLNDLMNEMPDFTLNQIKDKLYDEYVQYTYAFVYYEDQILAIRFVDDVANFEFVQDRDTFEILSYIVETSEEAKNKIQFEKDSKAEEKSNNEVVNNEENEKVDINPHKLFKEIKKIVKGQDEAIKQIVTTIWKNYTGEYTSNMIVLGPSGCGKTEILRQTAKLLDLPLLMTSVSGMSQAGYKGTGTDEILSSLLTLTKGDVEKAEHAIVVLDEFDKIAYVGSESGKVSTDGVQNELLKMVEDGVYAVEYVENGMHFKKTINTEKITFIGVGAFTNILTTEKKKQAGFGSDIYQKEIAKDRITSEDLIKFGIKAELVGRMGKIVRLNDLSLNVHMEIIKDSKKSLYNSTIKMIREKGIKIVGTEEEIIKEIAKLAMSKKTGAREISNIVDSMFSDIMFDISDPEEKYAELEISKETVNNPKKYILRK